MGHKKFSRNPNVLIYFEPVKSGNIGDTLCIFFFAVQNLQGNSELWYVHTCGTWPIISLLGRQQNCVSNTLATSYFSVCHK